LIKLNKALIEKSSEVKPDFIFLNRVVEVFPETLAKIKANTNAIILAYNNDDPFSPKHPKYLWRHYLNCVPFYDHVFAYRLKNIKDYASIGCQKTSLLRSYYIEKNNFPIVASNNQYSCDINFIGHFENDGRDIKIKSLFEAGFNVKLLGTLWEKSKLFPFFLDHNGPIKPVINDYNLAINSAKISLVFLSKINNDTYTRRCFEIPATKTMMVAEYTDDLATLFEEGKEVEFFRSNEELIEKLRFYIARPNLIKSIGYAGYARLLKDKHEVTDRAAQVIEIFEQLKNEQNPFIKALSV
jgi:spore maturation protein CgeB